MLSSSWCWCKRRQCRHLHLLVSAAAFRRALSIIVILVSTIYCPATALKVPHSHTPTNQRRWNVVYSNCSVLFFSRSRSEAWPHHVRTFSIYLCPLSFWLTLPRGESCPPIDVAYPGRAWSSWPVRTWHCSLHYLFLQATPSLGSRTATEQNSYCTLRFNVVDSSVCESEVPVPSVR